MPLKASFKRQRCAGKSWFPFDQIDYIIGGLFVSSIVVQLSITEYLAVAVTWFVLHVVSAYIGYLLKLKMPQSRLLGVVGARHNSSLPAAR